MENISQHVTGIRREVLKEMEYAEMQLMALAGAIPSEDYGWVPAEGARSVAAVLVHIAAGNLLLLARAGAFPPAVVELYGGIEGDKLARLVAMIRKNLALEKTMTFKAAVQDLLARSFTSVKAAWTSATEEELWVTENYFGEPETRRRLYLRMLAHSHEHMGQLIAYVRMMGYRIPWPDPLQKLEEMEATIVGHG